jgi:hypothetical protein
MQALIVIGSGDFKIRKPSCFATEGFVQASKHAVVINYFKVITSLRNVKRDGRFRLPKGRWTRVIYFRICAFTLRICLKEMKFVQ